MRSDLDAADTVEVLVLDRYETGGQVYALVRETRWSVVAVPARIAEDVLPGTRWVARLDQDATGAAR
ncbi:MAG TPA: hypothetical protein VFJ19_09455 [Nocardioidaceae bacterium]|nr:hypothetical protein [Nocardioidaceae bacterium]